MNIQNPKTVQDRRNRRMLHGSGVLSLGLLTAIVTLLMLSATASAALQFSDTQVGLSGPDGEQLRQAGAHPDLTFRVDIATDTHVTDGSSVTGPAEQAHSIDLDLPPGLVGNPTVGPTCSATQMANGSLDWSGCPSDSQIGTAEFLLVGETVQLNGTIGIYNMDHGPDVAARFGFKLYGAVVLITARVRPGDYGISSGGMNISQALPLQWIKTKFWGVPADPSHDAERVYPYVDGGANGPFVGGQSGPLPSTVARRPFLTSPTNCSAARSVFTVRGDSWEHQGVFDTRTMDSDPSGDPFLFAGCEQLAFKPLVSVQPLSHTADAPTGADVDITVPQNEDPDGLATPQVRRVVTTFPEGMSVSPSSAAGLGACSSAQINLGSNDAPTCPASSKIGTVKIDTPLLEDPLEGDVILASQGDNPFNSLVALYIVAKGPGFYLKLPGKVDLDPVTGRVVSTFDSTPQLPFSKLHIALQGGSQAPLATPAACGTYNTRTSITSWASDTPVELDAPMSIDQGCDPVAFAPSFAAGTTSPLAGKDSPFTFTLTRTDRMPALSRIDTTLPAGLLARIASVPQCAESLAANGACPSSSDIGSTSALSGPGAAPLALKGRVFLTGPYKDAPFGLAIEVPTAGQAGPFDLGTVTVRAGIYVDRITAQASVKSDPLPTIIQGIPLRLRQVGVSIDRPGFMFNPSSCQPMRIFGSFAALGGATSDQSVPFQVGGCSDLDLAPKLALSLSGKGQTTDGKHPAVTATLTQPAGQANLKKVRVALPLSLALDPDNSASDGLCSFVEGSKPDPKCPASSVVGRATAKTPILGQPLSGPVYFVKNERKDPKSGRSIKTLPKLAIPLVGENGVALTLTGTSDVVDDQLVTTFDNIPDAPVSSFKLEITGGKKGILVVSDADICKSTQIADQEIDGQNTKQADTSVYIQTPSCPLKIMSKKTTGKTVAVKVSGLGAGKVTITGRGIKKTTKTIGKSTVATITAKRTKGKPGKVTVSFDPTGPAKAHKTRK